LSTPSGGGRIMNRRDKTSMRFSTLRVLALGALLVLAPATVLIAQDVPPASNEEGPNPSGEQPEPAAEQRASASRDPLEIYSDLNLFGDIFDRIRAEYVDPPDEQELIRAAIQGMLSSLDPHSGYLPPSDYDDTRQDISGQFGGLGIEVMMEDGVIRVVSPIDDTPAARAGILTNDYI